MSSEEFLMKVSGVLAEYTTTFAFNEKGCDSASRWAMNWMRDGFDADSIIAGLREGMTSKVIDGKSHLGAHYNHLRKIILSHRSSSVKHNTPKEGCDKCAGGIVIVPHPMCVENMSWNEIAHRNGYYTCAVFCSCKLGEYKASIESPYEKNGKALKMWTLHGYEDFVAGNWAELMIQRDYLYAEKHKRMAEQLKLNRPVISEVRRGPLPDAVSFPAIVTSVVQRSVPVSRPQIAAKPQEQRPASPPPAQQETGNGYF